MWAGSSAGGGDMGAAELAAAFCDSMACMRLPWPPMAQRGHRPSLRAPRAWTLARMNDSGLCGYRRGEGACGRTHGARASQGLGAVGSVHWARWLIATGTATCSAAWEYALRLPYRTCCFRSRGRPYLSTAAAGPGRAPGASGRVDRSRGGTAQAGAATDRAKHPPNVSPHASGALLRPMRRPPLTTRTTGCPPHASGRCFLGDLSRANAMVPGAVVNSPTGNRRSRTL